MRGEMVASMPGTPAGTAHASLRRQTPGETAPATRTTQLPDCPGTRPRVTGLQNCSLISVLLKKEVAGEAASGRG